MDTETTGLEPSQGHRIVEIGAVELFNFMPTGRVYHQYINPERDMPAEAFAVHGLSTEFLKGFPVFAEIADDFLEFIDGARLVIHNAAFDKMFLDAELGRIGRPPLVDSRLIDTLAIARRRFPGAPVSLDALCRRFGVDNSGREKHGALLDSEILAEVYLELIGGRQPDFGLVASEVRDPVQGDAGWRPAPRPRNLPKRVTEAELDAHRALVRAIGADAIWNRRT